MTKSLDQLRRDARRLRKSHEAGELDARQRLANSPPRANLSALKHADYLHVIARENGFASWPALKLAADLVGMDMAAKRQRMKHALYNGQFGVADQLLQDAPDLAEEDFSLCLWLYRLEPLRAMLADRPTRATEPLNGQTPPLTVLARSKWIHHQPSLERDMLEIARLLLENGADLDLGAPVYDDSHHLLSPLYFAIGHADNMALGRWLLEQGANPDDNESLYHATELGHHEGLRVLLAHGANPQGTNALLRAMDFHDVAAVRMLLEHGAQVDEFNDADLGGESPWVVPALHQAARRMSPPNMVALLLAHGADVNRQFEGATPYAYARVFGNAPLATLLKEYGADTTLSTVEKTLATIADGADAPLNTEDIPKPFRQIIREILQLPGKLPHVQRLARAGVPHDTPDTEGLTPVQVAGWEGLPDVMAYLLSLKPDLTHVNGYGGTLLSTILHGSENCPQRAERDYVTCLRLALEQGATLPRRALELAGDGEIAEFLRDWAETHPQQLGDGGAV